MAEKTQGGTVMVTKQAACPYCGYHSRGINPHFCLACGRRWPSTRAKRQGGDAPKQLKLEEVAPW